MPSKSHTTGHGPAKYPCQHAGRYQNSPIAGAQRADVIVSVSISLNCGHAIKKCDACAAITGGRIVLHPRTSLGVLEVPDGYLCKNGLSHGAA